MFNDGRRLGPAGVRRGVRVEGRAEAPAAAWLPSDITGVAEWWRADLGVTDAGGGAVSAWQGQIAGETLSQGTAAARPTLTTRDSQPVLSFDGGDYLGPLTFATLGTLSAGGAVVAVFEHAAGGALEQVIDGASALQRWEVLKASGDNVIGASGTSRVLGAWSGMHAALANLGATGTGYLDNFTTPGFSGSFGTETLSGLTVGALYTGASQFMTGWVWEVIVCSTAISDDDRALLGAYLDARYAGLSLTY